MLLNETFKLLEFRSKTFGVESFEVGVALDIQGQQKTFGKVDIRSNLDYISMQFFKIFIIFRKL